MLAGTAFVTLHSLVAFASVVAGLLGLASDGRISTETLAGKVYAGTAFAACVSGLILFHSSGTSVIIGLVTLAAFACAAAATRANLFRWRLVAGGHAELLGHLRAPALAPASPEKRQIG